jgi:hypothetical protein
MAYSANRLPNRFPVGTKFVIEGHRAGEGEVRVTKRFLEFPDGTHLRLPARQAKRVSVAAIRRVRRHRQAASDRAPQPGGKH